jgi:glycosyltransferase involved in cell wall biosynthesis
VSIKRFAFLLPDMRGGGAERVALTLMRDFVGRGYSVDLIVMRARGELLALLPVQVRVIDLNAQRVRNLVRPLSKYLRDERPVALQVSMWPLTIAGILARILSRSHTRLIVSDHAALSKEYAERGFFHRQFLKWSLRLFYPRADARVVVAKETARDLSQLSGLPADRFEVIYNPIAPPTPIKVDPAVDQLWGGDGHRILNVARMNPQKNQKLLIDAFARLTRQINARLMILGEGALRENLERQASELGVGDCVIMPGFRLDPTPFYRSADLFVLSSDFEGYPLVLMEAMQCGLSIVSTDCLSGPSEILNGGEFGWLTPCGDSERLTEGMLVALKSPMVPGKLKARAEELSAHAAENYLKVMISA